MRDKREDIDTGGGGVRGSSSAHKTGISTVEVSRRAYISMLFFWRWPLQHGMEKATLRGRVIPKRRFIGDPPELL
jgi:hypothetical protein